MVASEKAVAHARNEVETTIGEKNKALQDVAELRKVVSSEVFKKVFDYGFNQVRDSYKKQVAELCPSIF